MCVFLLLLLRLVCLRVFFSSSFAFGVLVYVPVCLCVCFSSSSFTCDVFVCVFFSFYLRCSSASLCGR